MAIVSLSAVFHLILKLVSVLSEIVPLNSNLVCRFLELKVSIGRMDVQTADCDA